MEMLQIMGVMWNSCRHSVMPCALVLFVMTMKAMGAAMDKQKMETFFGI